MEASRRAVSSHTLVTGLESSKASESFEPLGETRNALAALARNRFGKVPVAVLAELVIAHTPDADWPVRRAAMEALIRRAGFAKRDATSVLARPARAVGLYQVGSKGTAGVRAARQYRTEICSLDPLRTSCDCPDFVRGALGVCKHGLAVLLSLPASAFSQASRKRGSGPRRKKPRLQWSAVAPLTGPHDRLASLRMTGPEGNVKRFTRARPADDATWPAHKRLRWIENQLLAIRKGQLTAEPAAKRVLEEERTRAERWVANARGLPRAEAATAKLQRTLYDYQKQGVRQFLESGRLLLADDMGLGKTTQAVACCHALYTTGRIDRGLLVVPAALRSQWLREWRETTKTPLVEVQGNADERALTYRKTKRGLLLIGYELLLRDLPHVQAFAPELVLLDEAQRIKNWATKSAASIKSLGAEYRLVLTGTPMENRFDELASIMDFVDDTALEPKWRLVPWHSISVANADRGVGGARNLSVLRQRLGASFLRRQRAEVLSQLPPRTDTRVAVELTPEQGEEHDNLDRPIAGLVRTAQVRPLTQPEFLRLMQLLTTQRMICNGLAQLHFDQEWPRCQATQCRSERFLRTLYAPKLVAFRDLVQQLVVEQGRKVVVFSQWRKMLRLAKWSVEDVLDGAGKRAGFFTGAESRNQRERALVDFHDDPALAVLFLSDAGGVGLNLQRAASCCINLELPWNPAVLEQRIGRIYRLGQADPVEVLNLVSERGIESRIAELVAQKQAVFSTLFDGTSDEVRFDGDRSFLAGVKKLMEPADVTEPVSGESADAESELEVIAAELAGSEWDSGSDGSQFEDTLAGSAEIPEPAAGHAVTADATTSSARAARTSVAASQGPELMALTNALAGLSVELTPSGRLRIETPPELAAPLARVLEILAASLKTTAVGAREPYGSR